MTISPTHPLTAADAAQPRAIGALRLGVGPRGLVDLRQQGSLKCLFPRGGPAGTEAVLLNTAGGITGGDRFTVAAEALPGARLTLSTQAAERAYRSRDGAGRIDTELALGAGARLDWLPQETILYDGCDLARQLRVDMAADATALLCESVIFGRRAMGERLGCARLRDRWELRRAGRLVHADAWAFGGDLEARLDRAGQGGGHRAFASVIFAAPGAGAQVAPLRALLPGTGGVSEICEDIVALRLLASDGFALRATLLPCLEVLAGRGLPKVWRL